MILIVGLGNPGRKFQKTRHNLGFRIIDRFKKRNRFSNWKEKKRLRAKISEGTIKNKKIVLAKPQTFMNASGEAVKALISNYQPPIANLWVLHDDFYIPLGKLKISKGKGPGGHKGVESIVKNLKTKEFVRFRLGTAPEKSSQRPLSRSRFVLQKFSQKEEVKLKEVTQKGCQAIETAIVKGTEMAMQEYNKKTEKTPTKKHP